MLPRHLMAKMVLLAGLLAALVTAGLAVWAFWGAGRSIFDLLNENRRLRQAISNLTTENQVGYAKVLAQTERDGRRYTRLLFVETARDDPQRRVLEREYEVEGDVVTFDALLVIFSEQYVSDGRSRTLYLWRKVYSPRIAADQGFAIEAPGSDPQRYSDISKVLTPRERRLFWTEIWNLANDPDRLKSCGIKAINIHALSQPLRPGLIYVFKVGNAGQFYVEPVPAL